MGKRGRVPEVELLERGFREEGRAQATFTKISFNECRTNHICSK